MTIERFVLAQAPVYDQVLAELRSGRKRSHWMWFVFPQLKGLGHSHMATFYGLGGLTEAKAYLAHPVLGPRLKESVEIILAIKSASAREILGSPDDLKFFSCLTLFDAASQVDCFDRALERFYQGRRDAATIGLLGTR
jgi:uncharacterized protein (DUF1810 family)